MLLISDGHANAGITDPAQLGPVAATAGSAGITTTTLGFGLGYDERLLRAIAAGGNGSELFAEHADDAVAAIAKELDGLLDADRAGGVVADPDGADLQAAAGGQRTVVGGARRTVFRWSSARSTPARSAGSSSPSTCRGSPPSVWPRSPTWPSPGWNCPGWCSSSVTVPVHVNVLPGDQAAGRIPDPVVRTELAYLQTQQAKRAAAERMSRGRCGRRAGQI